MAATVDKAQSFAKLAQRDISALRARNSLSSAQQGLIQRRELAHAKHAQKATIVWRDTLRQHRVKQARTVKLEQAHASSAPPVASAARQSTHRHSVLEELTARQGPPCANLVPPATSAVKALLSPHLALWALIADLKRQCVSNAPREAFVQSNHQHLKLVWRELTAQQD